MAVADPAVALTFARTEGTRRVLAVTRHQDGVVEAVDLALLIGRPIDDPVPLLLAEGYDALRRRLDAAEPRHRVSLPARALGLPLDLRALHVGVGLNFPAHADESGAGTRPFLFPKATAPTGPWAPVAVANRLLDYEVELAWVPLAPLGADDGAGRVGLVVCNDYTDREALLRAIDPWDPGSGQGFTTGKSFAGSLPVGPFLVVPRDTRAFLDGLELRLWVNGRLRQRAPAAAMTWRLDRLVAETLAGADRAWDHRGAAVRLPVADGRIPDRTLVMSGTPDGTVFQAIGTRQRLRGVAGWVLGGFRRPVAAHVIDAYLRDAHAEGIYLQPGDRVVAAVDGVGLIENEVIP
jgi:2-keto-4-pentenoate hydratase/2-oxohepta-3-ene-1,7-dioic acid hydratase in catechol pathway